MTIEDFKSLLRFRINLIDNLIKDGKQIQYNIGRKHELIDVLYDLEDIEIEDNLPKEEPQY